MDHAQNTPSITLQKTDDSYSVIPITLNFSGKYSVEIGTGFNRVLSLQNTNHEAQSLLFQLFADEVVQIFKLPEPTKDLRVSYPMWEFKKDALSFFLSLHCIPGNHQLHKSIDLSTDEGIEIFLKQYSKLRLEDYFNKVYIFHNSENLSASTKLHVLTHIYKAAIDIFNAVLMNHANTPPIKLNETIDFLLSDENALSGLLYKRQYR